MSQAKMRGRGRGSGPTHRPTIKDVASKAKVSVGTVSRVLNGNKSVGADIKARVERTIAQLDYQPDAVAQGMRSGSMRSVGFIIRDITVPALAAFVKAAQAVCHDEGYTLVIGCSDDRPRREVELLEALRRRVDGLIMTTASEEEPELNAVRNALDIPLVVMDREASGNVDSVTIAQREGMYRAVKYLLSLGHRRIALVTGATDVFSSRERVQGYKDAFAEAGVAVDPDLIRTHSFTADFAYMAVSALLRGRNRPTAVVAGGISMLTGILRAISTERLRIPQDISVIGAGDSELAELIKPPVTVVRWNYNAVGEAGAKLVIDRIHDRSLPPRRLHFPTELIIRESCAPPKKG